MDMKHHFSRILTLTALCLLLGAGAGTELFAQNNGYTQVPVEVSKEKVKVGGKLCYSHVVQERQTLYSISKAYGVAIEDIYRFNPGLKEKGLQKNAIIVIPSPEALSGKAAKGGKKSEEAKAPDDKAKAKAQEASTEESAEPVKDAKIHSVKWFETLETIAAKYDVTPDDIIRANSLQSTTLKSKQQLIIPTKAQSAQWQKERELAEAKAAREAAETAAEKAAREQRADAEASAQKAAEQEYFSADNSIVENASNSDNQQTVENNAPKDKVSIALMLPFKSRDEKPSSSAMDFYCGALLASRTLGNEGLNLNVDVYDVADTDYPITKEAVSGDDFVIGPLAPADIEKVYGIIGEDKPLISPLDPKAASLATRYPKLIQVPTPHDLQYADLVQWLSEETADGDRTVLIREKGGKESEAMNSLISMLDLTGVKYTTISYSILEGRDILESLKTQTVESKAGEKGKLRKGEKDPVNRFVIASESEAFVSDAFRNIGLLKRENRNVEIFCHSKVRGYDIEVESLHNNDLHISLAYYIDYNSPEVIRFVKQYRALFKTEPTQFSFQGYDIVLYFARLCAQKGDGWLRAIGTAPKSMLQTRFDFRDGSRINEGVRRIEYVDDYKIKCL